MRSGCILFNGMIIRQIQRMNFQMDGGSFPLSLEERAGVRTVVESIYFVFLHPPSS